jgi:hypothetical protein
MLQLLPLDLTDIPRMRELISKYADRRWTLLMRHSLGLLSVKASEKSSP